MRRREFLGVLGGTAVAWPVAARGQQGIMPMVAFLERSGPIRNDFGDFREGLRALGYEEGRNIRIERRYGYGDDQKLRELAEGLVLLNPVAIVVDGSVTIDAVQTVTRTIPIVSAIISDPERFGITQLSRPAGNLTGLSNLSDTLFAKRLALLKDMLPHMRNVAFLQAPPSINSVATRVVGDTAKSLGLNVRTYDAGERNSWPSMFAAMKSECDGLLQIPDGRFAAAVANLVVLAVAHHLPAVYGEREFVDAGGLMSYGVSFPDQWRRAAGYVDKIIKGARAGDLPIEQPTRFALVININTARALGLTIPPNLLSTADEVIE